jgi:hypothetical protein
VSEIQLQTRQSWQLQEGSGPAIDLGTRSTLSPIGFQVVPVREAAPARLGPAHGRFLGNQPHIDANSPSLGDEGGRALALLVVLTCGVYVSARWQPPPTLQKPITACRRADVALPSAKLRSTSRNLLLAEKRGRCLSPLRFPAPPLPASPPRVATVTRPPAAASGHREQALTKVAAYGIC